MQQNLTFVLARVSQPADIPRLGVWLLETRGRLFTNVNGRFPIIIQIIAFSFNDILIDSA
jgi:hypothetical protein